MPVVPEEKKMTMGSRPPGESGVRGKLASAEASRGSKPSQPSALGSAPTCTSRDRVGHLGRAAATRSATESSTMAALTWAKFTRNSMSCGVKSEGEGMGRAPMRCRASMQTQYSTRR